MPALFYRRVLVGARRAAEGFVAVREAAEAVDDVEMFLRIILEHRVVEPAEQPQRFALIADVLAVLEGQAGVLAPTVGPGLVPEIGSASCRERVCQYVGISVVVVAYKYTSSLYLNQKHETQ